LNTSYSTLVINDTDVDTIVVTLTLSNIVVGNWFWSNALPEDIAIVDQEFLLIIPVNSSYSRNTRSSYSASTVFKDQGSVVLIGATNRD
jgi:hypothetical protein